MCGCVCATQTHVNMSPYGEVSTYMALPLCNGAGTVSLWTHWQMMEGRDGGRIVGGSGLLSCECVQAFPHLCHRAGLFPYLRCASLSHLEPAVWAGLKPKHGTGQLREHSSKQPRDQMPNRNFTFQQSSDDTWPNTPSPGQLCLICSPLLTTGMLSPNCRVLSKRNNTALLKEKINKMEDIKQEKT